MPRTLVTGANGFVGVTVIETLLSANPPHQVTGAVRSKQSGKELLTVHPEWDASKVDFVEVKDYTAEGAFDQIFQQGDFDYVIHLAAPLPDNPANADFEEDYEKPNVDGNIQLLKSAKAHGKNLKAIAVTGSINAITTGSPEDLESRVISNSEWLPLGRDEAIQMQSAYISYCVGKKLAELAIWDFVEKEKPSFSVTNFLPPLIFGPPLQKIRDLSKINLSTDAFYSLFNGTNKVTPPTMFPGYIDLRDLAALLVNSLSTPAAANKRYVVGFPMTYKEITDSLKKLPEFKERVPQDSNEGPRNVKIDTTAVEKDLPIKYHTKDETFQETAKYLVGLEKK